MIELVMAEKRTEDLDARKMEAFQSNTKNAKSIKCDNEKQQIRTHSFSLRDVKIAQWARGALSKVLYEEGSPTFPPPLLILLHTIFDRKGTPFVYLLLTNDIPSNCRKCTISLQIMNKSLNQDAFVTLLELQNASVIYSF